MTRKKILLIATGGTIASRPGEDGLAPALTSEELLACIPEVRELCHIDTVQLFNLDSTNMRPENWLAVAALIRERSAAVIDPEIRNGAISCTADAAEGRFLILSVPASKGWTAFVNGKKTPIDTYEGCLVKIPLAQGENHITMQYRVPGMAAGIVMTLIGAAACFAMMLTGGRRGI